MCLSISGSCLNAPRITNVRTFHCGEYPGTLDALVRINTNKHKKQGNNQTQSAAQRAGLLAVFSDDFLRNSSSVHVDNRTDSVYVSISLSTGVFSGDRRGVSGLLRAFSAHTLD